MPKNNNLTLLLVIIACLCFHACNNTSDEPVGDSKEIGYWITKADQSMLLQKQMSPITFNSPANNNVFLDIDTTSFQTVDGFGYTLTGGSASLINKMKPGEKSNLLNELFGNTDNSICRLCSLSIFDLVFLLLQRATLRPH